MHFYFFLLTEIENYECSLDNLISNTTIMADLLLFSRKGHKNFDDSNGVTVAKKPQMIYTRVIAFTRKTNVQCAATRTGVDEQSDLYGM